MKRMMNPKFGSGASRGYSSNNGNNGGNGGARSSGGSGNNGGHGSYNPSYSLSYRFDSASPAGKCNGTALDLIRRYNDLAKEARTNGDYVNAEVFSQYAEHYRKIVTDINERRGYTPNYQPRNRYESGDAPQEQAQPQAQPQMQAETETVVIGNEVVSSSPAPAEAGIAPRELKIVDMSNEGRSENNEQPVRQKRPYHRRTPVAGATAAPLPNAAE